MIEEWFLCNKQGNFPVIAQQCGISEIMAKLIVNRGITSREQLEEYLDTKLDRMHKPNQLKDLEKACGILEQKIREKKSIRVIGDYDVDGVMSSYILVYGLRQCGAVVDYEIPDRKKDGYGINMHLIKQAENDLVDTIITCDNGIAALDEIAYGKQVGMTMIVTDHHNIVHEEKDGEKRYVHPIADAVVNPKQPQCSYPYEEICGAVVVYKLIQELYHRNGKPKEEAENFLEFAAIATVCDVMDLENENRIIVKHGLERLKHSNNIGIQALLEVTGLKGKELQVYHLGFIIGPCINASGRLESAKFALQMLLSNKKEEADILAAQLKAFNDERKDMTSRGEEEAQRIIEEQHLEKDRILVIYLPDCHESLAGIIAGRMKDRYNKPTLVLTKGEEGAKGSGRSIESYHMFDKLTECKELLTRFGGHKMAAGFSLEEKNIAILRKCLNEQCGLEEKDFIQKITFDAVLPLNKISVPLIQEFHLLEPYGKGNKKPLFALKNVEVIKIMVLGVNQNVLRLSLKTKEDHKIYNGILFRNIDHFKTCIEEKYGKYAWNQLCIGKENKIEMDIIFYPDINTYKNTQNIQIVLEHYR